MSARRAPQPWSGEPERVPPVDAVEPVQPAADVQQDVPPSLRRYLLPSERIVVAVRRHPAQLAEPVVTAALGFAVLLVADAWLPASLPAVRDVLFLAWFALLARTAWRFVEWRADWFIATDRRLLLRYGVLNRRVAMMPFSKVTDMSYNQSLPGRLLHYGQFVMESAGQEQALRVVSWLPVPDRLYLSICAEIFGADHVPPVVPTRSRPRRRERR